MLVYRFSKKMANTLRANIVAIDIQTSQTGNCGIKKKCYAGGNLSESSWPVLLYNRVIKLKSLFR
jgi:hypothetical protein